MRGSFLCDGARLTLTGDLGRLGEEERGFVRVTRRTTVGRRVMLRLLLRSRRLVRGKAIEGESAHLDGLHFVCGA